MRTEEQILKDFEKLGYVIDDDENHCDMENEYSKKHILINKNLQILACCRWELKPYETIINGTKMTTKHYNTAEPIDLLMNEFKLLHELFECWGWLK